MIRSAVAHSPVSTAASTAFPSAFISASPYPPRRATAAASREVASDAVISSIAVPRLPRARDTSRRSFASVATASLPWSSSMDSRCACRPSRAATDFSPRRDHASLARTRLRSKPVSARSRTRAMPRSRLEVLRGSRSRGRARRVRRSSPPSPSRSRITSTSVRSGSGSWLIPVRAREQPHGRHLGVHVPQTVEDVDRLPQVGHPFLAPQGVPRRRRGLQEEVGALRTVRA